MKIVDAHHHLWDMQRLNYPWLANTDQQAIFGNYDRLRKNYSIEAYRSESKTYDVVKSVHVEADQDPRDPVAETVWLQDTAASQQANGMPQAIVAFADFTREDVDDTLAAHCKFPAMRGIRQILNYHSLPKYTYTSRDYLQDAGWRQRFSLLRKHGLSFDLQIYYQQMSAAATLARDNDEIQIILNHAGMPIERGAEGIAGWRSGIAQLAACPNVAVKISGLGMCEPQWTVDSLRPFVLDTINRFGVDRCMFGSNFPVDSLFSGFDTLFNGYSEITAHFSVAERRKLFCENAERVYRI